MLFYEIVVIWTSRDFGRYNVVVLSERREIYVVMSLEGLMKLMFSMVLWKGEIRTSRTGGHEMVRQAGNAPA